ncbi:MAG: heme biosynthesis HemY N-terminal domain-containing protein [Pseudomonadota bacterium]
MRKLFAISLVFLLLGVGAVALIETDPGYVLLSYGNWTLETSLWVGLLLLLLFVLVLYWLVRLILRLLSGQRNLAAWFGGRKARQARRLSDKGLQSYLQGDWAAARRQLERGARNSESPLLNHLLAARASEQLGEEERLHEFLSAARSTGGDDSAVAVELTLADIRLRGGDFQAALSALDESQGQGAKHPNVLRIQRRAYEGLGEWENLLAMLPELKKHKVYGQQELEQLEREIHAHRMQAPADGANDLLQRWQSVPAHLRRESALREAYVDRLAALGDDEAAEKAIVKSLKHSWNTELVRRYGLLQTPDTGKRLARGEGWLSEHPDDAELLLCLGRLCAREKLWGKAREYFEASYRIERSAITCAELGRLLSALGEPKVAAAYYREGLGMTAENLPDLPMPELAVSHG